MASAVFNGANPPPALDQAPTMPHPSEAVPFQGVLKLFNQLRKIREEGEKDFVNIKDITLDSFKTISKSRDRRNLKYRLDYDEEAELLVVKFPNDLHEALYIRLYMHYIFYKVSDGEAWLSPGATEFHAEIRGKTQRKEPDSAGGPIPERHGRNKWPTLAVQTGYSESLGHLHRGMQRWFELSKHDVKIVLLIHFDRTRQRFVIERWEEEGSAVRPVCQQVVAITRQETGGTANYLVTSGDIPLRFSLLFLRQPQGVETDIIITTDDLKKWAEFCWVYV